MTVNEVPPVVSPMAAPPITIGPFTNVPAPGSPIRSDWPQSISQYVADTRAHYIELRSGSNPLTVAPMTAVGFYDMANQTLGSAAVTTKVFLDVVVYAGFTSADMNVGVDVIRLDTGAVAFGSQRPYRVIASNSPYWPIPVIGGWNVAPGAELGFKVRFEIQNMAGAATLTATGTAIYRVQAT